MPASHTLSAWIKASRPTSQSYIFVPLLLGQAWFYARQGTLDIVLLVIIHLFGLCNQLYIVFANDYADQDADRDNTTFNLYSGGSRVLIDGILRPEQIKNAALIMAGLCGLIGVVLAFPFDRELSIPLILVGLALLWAYSYPPIRLSYQGGGELLQMTGVGLVLPLLGYYGQAGSLTQFPWGLVASLLPAQLACAMSTSLPDLPSDRSSGKRTAAVLLGPKVTRPLIIALNLVTIMLVFSHLSPAKAVPGRFWILLVPGLATLGHFLLLSSPPGSKRLIYFNTLSVLTILSLQIGLIVLAFSFGLP